MRKLIFKSYFSHKKENILVQIFIGLAIALPLLISNLFSDFIDVSLRHFIDNRCFDGDFLIQSSEMRNYHNIDGSLSISIQSIVEKHLKENFPSENSYSMDLYSLSNENNKISYVYTDLNEPGTNSSIVVTEKIPPGYFVSDVESNYPDTIYIVNTKTQSYKELKKYPEQINFPRSLQFDIAISKEDSNRLLFPAKLSFIVIDIFDDNNTDAINKFQKAFAQNDNILLFSKFKNDNYFEIIQTLATPIVTTHPAMEDIKERAGLAAYGFIVIFVSAMFFIASYYYKSRQADYKLYGLLGMNKTNVIITELIESILNWFIGTIFAIITIVFMNLFINLFNAPHFALDNIIPLYFDEVYAINGKIQMKISLIELIKCSLLYLFVYLISLFLIKLQNHLKTK